MPSNESVERFGQLVVRELRDKGIAFFDMLSQAKWKAPRLHQLQRDLNEMTESQRLIVRRCVIGTLDSAIHDFLFALQESTDRGKGIEVLVDGKNVAGLSDGLHGEPFGEDGWNARYSHYGMSPVDA